MPSKRTLCRAIAVTLTLGATLATGCSRGPEVGQVSGKVTFRGQPVGDGVIVFQDDAKGIAVSADLQSDGGYVVRTYAANGLPPGEYKVALTPRNPDPTGSLLITAPVAKKPVVDTFHGIPENLRNASTSKLRAVVKPGKNNIDFDL